MKFVLVLLLAAAAAWFVYGRQQGAPDVVDEIKDPVFAEMRVTTKVAGREIEFALFGKMADEADCRERAERVWSKVVEGCAECGFSVKACQAALPPRYARLFDNVPIPSTYLAFTRGERGERDGRMVIWGLTAAEGDVACQSARAEFAKRYKGQIECVAARAE